MSDTPQKRGPKPQDLHPYTALLTADHLEQLHAEGPRKGNQLIRDALDFVKLYAALFESFRKNVRN